MSLLARLNLTILSLSCAALFVLSIGAQAEGADQYACESYVDFVSPGQPEAAAYASYQPLPWNRWQKQKIDYTIGLVRSIAPGLLANACAGKKLTLINCGRNDKVYAQSYLTEIYLFPQFWQLTAHTTPWEVADMLAHEITHIVDNGNNLSRGGQWYALTADRIVDCKRAIATAKTPKPAQDAVARDFGLPSAYALKGPPESLAECVSANLFSKTFTLPSDLSEFIREQVLTEQPLSEYDQLMHAGWQGELSNEYDEAVDDYRKALKLQPKSVRARQGLSNCLLHLHQLEAAAVELKLLENILANEYALSEDHSELSGVRQQLAALKTYSHRRADKAVARP